MGLFGRKRQEGAHVAKDPVCGMDVEPGSAAGKAEHGGATYWFCSSGCAATFRASPQKFTSS